MTVNDPLETARANIIKIINKTPTRKNMVLADFKQAYFEVAGVILNPELLGFDNVETLLRVLAEDLVFLDHEHDTNHIVITFKDNGLLQVVIPTQEAPEEGQVVRVVVGQIVNPSKFFIQLASEYDRLNDLMDSLDSFYAKDRSSSQLTLEGCDVTVGDLVAVPWTDNMWYRGKVMGVKDLTTLKVFYMDYGSVADVKRTLARQLSHEFHYLPCQAILAKMSGLVPPDGRKWSGTSTARLLKLTRDSHQAPLQAIIRGREGDKVAVWLIDKDGEGVNELLVDEGLAIYDQGDYTIREVLASEDKNRDEEKANLEAEIMKFHKVVMQLSGHEEEWRVQEHLEKAQDHSRRLEQLQGAIKCSLPGSCVVEKKAVTTDWGNAWIHIIKVAGGSWIISTEVSSLVREWRGWDLLEKRLASKHLKLDKLIILKGDNTWKILIDNEVEGMKDKKGEFKDEVSLYRLDLLPDLFNLFTEKCKVTATSLAHLISMG